MKFTISSSRQSPKRRSRVRVHSSRDRQEGTFSCSRGDKHSPTERDRVEWHRRDRQKLARPSATGPTIRPSVAKQSAPQKKGAPKDEPFRQSLPADIKFGILDGNPVRFTNLEAWWLVDGTWRPISPDEVLSNAAVMRVARFKQQFPQVPLLPKKAFRSDHR